MRVAPYLVPGFVAVAAVAATASMPATGVPVLDRILAPVFVVLTAAGAARVCAERHLWLRHRGGVSGVGRPRRFRGQRGRPNRIGAACDRGRFRGHGAGPRYHPGGPLVPGRRIGRDVGFGRGAVFLARRSGHRVDGCAWCRLRPVVRVGAAGGAAALGATDSRRGPRPAVDPCGPGRARSAGGGCRAEPAARVGSARGARDHLCRVAFDGTRASSPQARASVAL